MPEASCCVPRYLNSPSVRPSRIAPDKCKDVVLDILTDALIEMALEEHRGAEPALTSNQSRPTDLPRRHEESKAS